MKSFKIEDHRGNPDIHNQARAEQEIHPYSIQRHEVYLDCQYLRVLRDIRTYGMRVPNRTGTDSICLPGMMARYDLRDRFPLLTTKQVFHRGIFAELAWMIRGETNIQSLKDEGVHIWDKWADEEGDLGPIYGAQWRRWGGSHFVPQGGADHMAYPIDQLAWAVDRLRRNPDCRRVIVSAWDPLAIPEMKLPPCHCFFQFRIVAGHLYTMLYQRSCDMFLGVPFNVASYAALTHLVAQVVGVKPGFLVHFMGDAHIYVDHLEPRECPETGKKLLSVVDEQLNRPAKPSPRLLCRAAEEWQLHKDARPLNSRCNDVEDMGRFLNTVKTDWWTVEGYNPHPVLKAPVAV